MMTLASMDEASGAAVTMRRYGGPDVLSVERVALAPLRGDEIRLCSIASAINHSDLEIRAGHWPIRRPDPFPYVPGLEVVGDVVEVGADVRDFHRGERAITMMQGLGGVRAERPGGYAQYVTVAAAAAAPVRADVDPLDLAALGLASVTAFEGLRKLGPIAGRRVAVTGASGGVGSAAVGLARCMGAAIVAIVSSPRRADYVRALGAGDVLTAEDVRAGKLAERSVDGVLDTMAGAAFGALVTAIRPGGTLSLVGAVGGADVTFDAYRLLEASLTGYSSEQLDGKSLRVAIDSIVAWLHDGRLRASARTLIPLAAASDAHALLERRGVEGRVLLVPHVADGAATH